MGRGYIYFITKDKHSDVSFGASNYENCLGELGVDYVKDEKKKESMELVQEFSSRMHQLRATTVLDNDKKDFKVSFYFTDADEAKRLYFEPLLKALKEQVEALTLENLISSGYSIGALVYSMANDNFGDLIEFENEVGTTRMTLDDFIRQIEPDVTYYVYKRVIFMH